MTDQRANHFPFKAVGDMAKHYTDLGFRDFKHGITGALLWKAQHPDVETFYGSKHQKAGVECSSCHMPKVRDAKTGKVFTSHWQTSPRHYVKETCLTCHSKWTEQQVGYVLDSLKNRYDGKLRKAEFWLTRLVDKFEEAQNLGVEAGVLNDVRKKHDEAHINWEWWTAVNGAYFHNPDAATESLNRSHDVLAGRHQAARRCDGEAARAGPCCDGKRGLGRRKHGTRGGRSSQVAQRLTCGKGEASCLAFLFVSNG